MATSEELTIVPDVIGTESTDADDKPNIEGVVEIPREPITAAPCNPPPTDIDECSLPTPAIWCSQGISGEGDNTLIEPEPTLDSNVTVTTLTELSPTQGQEQHNRQHEDGEDSSLTVTEGGCGIVDASPSRTTQTRLNVSKDVLVDQSMNTFAVTAETSDVVSVVNKSQQDENCVTLTSGLAHSDSERNLSEDVRWNVSEDVDKAATLAEPTKMLSKTSLPHVTNNGLASVSSAVVDAAGSAPQLPQLKLARKSTTSIKNIIDAFELQPLKDYSFHNNKATPRGADRGGGGPMDDDVTTPTPRITKASLNLVIGTTTYSSEKATVKEDRHGLLPFSSTAEGQCGSSVANTITDNWEGNASSPPPVKKEATGGSGGGLVTDLVYWREPQKTGLVLTVLLVVLTILRTCSIISIVAWSCLALIAAGSLQRVFSQTTVRQRRSNKLDVFMKAFSDQNVRENTDLVVSFVELWFTRARKILLAENMIDTLQVAVLCYLLTYVGAWFNGLTVASVLLACLFSLPKLYDTHKARILGAMAGVGHKWNQLAIKVKEVEEEAGEHTVDVQELF